MPNLGWTVVRVVTGVVASKAAVPLVNTAWKVITPKAKPKKNDFNSPIVETIAFTAVSAAIGGVVTMLAQRSAAKWMGMDKVLGSATKGVEEAIAEAEKRTKQK